MQGKHHEEEVGVTGRVIPIGRSGLFLSYIHQMQQEMMNQSESCFFFFFFFFIIFSDDFECDGRGATTSASFLLQTLAGGSIKNEFRPGSATQHFTYDGFLSLPQTKKPTEKNTKEIYLYV